MRLTLTGFTVAIDGLDDIPGELAVIGNDPDGAILASSALSVRAAFFLVARLRRQGWHPQGLERQHRLVVVVLAKRCVGRSCRRCEGLGLVPYYEHVDEGRCFACGGTGQPQAFTSHRSGRAERGHTMTGRTQGDTQMSPGFAR
jgi:hypothetical protein